VTLGIGPHDLERGRGVGAVVARDPLDSLFERRGRQARLERRQHHGGDAVDRLRDCLSKAANLLLGENGWQHREPVLEGGTHRSPRMDRAIVSANRTNLGPGTDRNSPVNTYTRLVFTAVTASRRFHCRRSAAASALLDVNSIITSGSRRITP